MDQNIANQIKIGDKVLVKSLKSMELADTWHTIQYDPRYGTLCCGKEYTVIDIEVFPIESEDNFNVADFIVINERGYRQGYRISFFENVILKSNCIKRGWIPCYSR